MNPEKRRVQSRAHHLLFPQVLETVEIGLIA